MIRKWKGTYSVSFLVEHKRGNGPTSVGTVTGLATNTDCSTADAELVLGTGDSVR